MKTRDEMIYDFLLALAPSYAEMYEAIFVEGCGHTDAFNRAADEIYKRAEKLTEMYLEDVAP
jgi:hypothetical protein